MQKTIQVKGFRAAAVEAGIKYANRLDLGLIYSTVPATAAGVFTTNTVKAAPIQLCMERLAKNGQVQAVLVNSGNANACTGKAGMDLALAAGRELAKSLQIDEDLIQIASTGVIGLLPEQASFSAAMPALVERLHEDGFFDVAKAIMTTDTTAKTAHQMLEVDGKTISVLGVAKGSGMIMPNMATMLGFLVTDAAVEPETLQELVRTGVEQSFNRITVDGDTSTNDMVLLLANGAAENAPLDKKNRDASALAEYKAFQEAVYAIMHDLALQIARDGEGANKLVTIRVNGAASQAEADDAARTIANSPLVKTAFFGEDANWGRIIAALGRSQATFAPEHVEIAFDDVMVVKNGVGLGADQEEPATQVLKKDTFTVTINLHNGKFHGEMYTCDFSYDYVRINADYRS